MDFTVIQQFPATTEDVLALYCDPSFFTSLPASDKLATPELVDHRADDRQVVLALRYHYIGDLPSAASRFVDPAQLTWIETTTIDLGSLTGHATLAADHYATLLSSDARYVIEAADDGSRRTVRGSLSVHVPLFGGRVESAIVEGLEQHLHAEADHARRRLSA